LAEAENRRGDAEARLQRENDELKRRIEEMKKRTDWDRPVTPTTTGNATIKRFSVSDSIAKMDR
ncbi:MAG: hypothetical protein IJY15_01665, partial [Thermoguttaceae bacterium]|nr:hypothetical protein [Thermoguttaceae bacterium]